MSNGLQLTTWWRNPPKDPSRAGHMRASITHASLIIILLLMLQTGLLAESAASEVRISYQVDVKRTGKRVFSIKATAHELPEGIVRFGLSKSSISPSLAKQPHLMLEVRNGSGESVVLKEEEDSWILDNSSQGNLEFCYELRSGLHSEMSEISYLDSSRGLLHSSDFQLNFEGHDSVSNITFNLPSGWKAISPLNRVEEMTYLLNTGHDSIFYLGDATEVKVSVNSIAMLLGVEDRWPFTSQETLNELRRQLNYLGKTTRQWQAQPSLVLFWRARQDDSKTEAFSLHHDDFLLIRAPGGSLSHEEMQNSIRRQLTDELLQCYLPVLDSANEDNSINSLRQYLVWKCLLKTGATSRSDFLAQMALGFREWFNSLENPGNSVPKASKLRQAFEDIATDRRISVNFILDLSLSFYGKEKKSIFEFLDSSSAMPRDAKRIEEDLLKVSSAGRGEFPIHELLQSYATPVTVGEVLKLFGLTMVRGDVPKLGFGLTESFQIQSRSGDLPAYQSELLPGDRVVSVQNHRLVNPSDLIKVRSLLSSADIMNVTVERNGVFLQIRQPLAKEQDLRIEANKLSDADKLERLEGFLSREVED
jgi:hypothetical protein